ncbi:hypothetical protein UA08_06554 [Talaromyces atroroseus]|uniref:Pre-rRNA-processing protein las1 n=1 Tax=Talaromyces atroroseus TaxID=1441469 RepID=A0A225ALV3_TALAT|nr:hypothetical protein UA08_06554 [Talaromyces atroroseus]OKL58228.1 hypothetical protein UA08_06554 [Talaromyces atroroseus]
MPKITITPWRNITELLDVRSKFYPSSSSASDSRSDACRVVEAWKLRGHLPHAVEATALLTDAILHDDAERNSVFAIRATYAAAFSRFVTGLVDTKLGVHRGTMFSRASMIGLPLSFVELRHEAAHRELPSLVLLRNYTNRALEWLWGYYWAKIDAPLPSSATLTEAGTSSRTLTEDSNERDDLTIRIRHLLKQQQPDSSAGPPSKKLRSTYLPLAQSLSSVCSGSHEGALVLSRVLLEEGFLVPKDRLFGTSMERSFSTWDYTLQTISNSHQAFLTVLTEEMAKELDSAKDNTPSTKEHPYLQGVYMWLEHILTSDNWQKESLLLGSVSYIRTLCRVSPNHWTTMLERVLLSSLPTLSVSEVLSSSDKLAGFEVEVGSS